MRTEIERVNNELAQNRLEQSRTEQRVEIIAKAMSTAKTDKQRKKLQRDGNLATEALYKLVSVCNKLMVRSRSNFTCDGVLIVLGYLEQSQVRRCGAHGVCWICFTLEIAGR